MEQNMFIRILNSEMELATGCTEPGAVALTAAEAGQALRKAGVDKAEEITVNASINIIKNAMSAGIPGTDYEGMDYAAAIGALGGDPVYLLEVMNHVPRETVEAAAALVKAGKVKEISDMRDETDLNGLKLTLDYRTGDFGQLLDLVRREGMLENCTFTFWSDKEAKAFRQVAPEIRTLQAYVGGGAELDKVIAEINPNIAVIRIDSLDKLLVERCHKKGLKVLALALGTDDVEESDRKAIELGVDVLATDRPELFVKKYRPEHTWTK